MEILQNGFCMIPNVVLYDNELSDKQKLLYGTISSLCAEKGYCWASNKYLGELLGVKEWTISNAVKGLLDKGYIHSDINKDKGNERHLSLSCEISQGGIVKNHNRYCEKSQEINIIDKNNINIINNNTEFENSDLENNNSLSINNLDLKEKEKNSVKKEKEITIEINNLLEKIKNTCNELGVAYDKTKDRMFAKHILTAKEYGDLCDKIGQTRVEFASNVLVASVKINYWKGPLAGPMKIYQNYADLYNQAKSKIQKTITPTINVL